CRRLRRCPCRTNRTGNGAGARRRWCGSARLQPHVRGEDVTGSDAEILVAILDAVPVAVPPDDANGGAGPPRRERRPGCLWGRGPRAGSVGRGVRWAAGKRYRGVALTITAVPVCCFCAAAAAAIVSSPIARSVRMHGILPEAAARAPAMTQCEPC